MSQTYVLEKDNPRRLAILNNAVAFLERLPLTKSWQIEIKAYRKARSNPQNRALFGLAYVVLESETGYTKDQLHTAFCKRFFGTVTEKDLCGHVYERPYRTTTTGPNGEDDVISTKEFSLFYRLVQQVGAEAGVDVPDPDSSHNAPEW
jgi:hypothetical protein